MLLFLSNMSPLSTITAGLILTAITAAAASAAESSAAPLSAFATPAFQLPNRLDRSRTSPHHSITPGLYSSSSSSSYLMATRERSSPPSSSSSGRRRSSSSNSSSSSRRRDNDGHDFNDNNYGRNDNDFDDDFFDQPYSAPPKKSRNNNNNNRNYNGATSTTTPPSSSAASTTTAAASSTFFSQKSLTDPSFSIDNNNTNKKQQQSSFFQHLAQSANINRPSRIQSLAWPPLLRGENCIVADQTGSGKTLAYLLPLLQKLHQSDELRAKATEHNEKKRTGCPRVVILTPTAELADQIYSVCSSLSKNLSSSPSPTTTTSSSTKTTSSKGGTPKSWTFNPFVTTATGSHSTNIRDQIRLLQSTSVDVLISTPGRLSTILRTKNAGLDLGMVQSLVLDEVDFLLVDETFGPQLRTVGVAVNSGSSGSSGESGASGEGGDAANTSNDGAGPQFIFVTATLPDDVLQSITTEFNPITQLRGPGLHRITPTVTQTLIDVSVPADMNRDARACFDIKVRELLTALRARRCEKSLIFCNTVETCRDVENVLRRKDRRGRRNRVWAYHNALGADVRLKNLQAFSSSSSTNYYDGEEENGGGGSGSGTERILVCTDRAARGIDFNASPVDHVVLFDFPRDPAEYVRRVGRTARAGRTGASTVLAYGWQLPIARQIMGLSNDNKKGKKGGSKKGNAKLESFNMMKSSDGWESEEEKEDEYYIRGGARMRKESREERRGGGAGGGSGGEKKKYHKKKKNPNPKKATDKGKRPGKPWK